MKRVKFKINVPLKDMPAGALISLNVDAKGVPIDRYWRQRFLDASYDGCIEQICLDEPKKTKKAKEVFKESKDLD